MTDDWLQPVEHLTADQHYQQAQQRLGLRDPSTDYVRDGDELAAAQCHLLAAIYLQLRDAGQR